MRESWAAVEHEVTSTWRLPWRTRGDTASGPDASSWAECRQMAALATVPRVFFPARPVVSLVGTRWSKQPSRSVKLTVELFCSMFRNGKHQLMDEIPAFVTLLLNLRTVLSSRVQRRILRQKFNRCFGATYCLHLQGRRVSQASTEGGISVLFWFTLTRECSDLTCRNLPWFFFSLQEYSQQNPLSKF
jgi:hypothetical protein